jgi:hypothetical protein
MKYEFRVKFWRDWEQDEEVVKTTFPKLNPLAQAISQFCAELDDNSVVKGHYTVESANFADHKEVHFVVLFSIDFNPDPFQAFRDCLQKTFNEGMAGEFSINTEYLVDGKKVDHKIKHFSMNMGKKKKKPT